MPSIGFLVLLVDVVSIEPGDVAIVVNQFGKKMKVRTDIRRGNGPKPREGEHWFIDRTLGGWTFAACIQRVLPVITGSTDDNPALESLLTQLEAAGLIDNQTTSTQIHAALGHSH